MSLSIMNFQRVSSCHFFESISMSSSAILPTLFFLFTIRIVNRSDSTAFSAIERAIAGGLTAVCNGSCAVDNRIWIRSSGKNSWSTYFYLICPDRIKRGGRERRRANSLLHLATRILERVAFISASGIDWFYRVTQKLLWEILKCESFTLQSNFFFFFLSLNW